MSSRIVARVKQELLEVIPPAVFFFIAFQLLAFTRALMLKEYGIHVSTFMAATVGALIVAKVVLIVDLLPFVNRFPNKPLMYNVVWKTAIYLVAALLVRYVEHLIPFIREHRDFAVAHRHLLSEVVWPHFWAIQIWLLVLFFFYCALRELIRVIGRERVRQMFFGPITSDPASQSFTPES
jgi:chromate transport protein ChrA